MDKKAFNKVVDSLINNSDEWTPDNYTIMHISGIGIWTANIPILNTNFYLTPIKLSLWQKYKLYKAVNTAKSNIITNKLKRINNS